MLNKKDFLGMIAVRFLKRFNDICAVDISKENSFRLKLDSGRSTFINCNFDSIYSDYVKGISIDYIFNKLLRCINAEKLGNRFQDIIDNTVDKNNILKNVVLYPVNKENAKENELVKKLTNKHYTITTAESCTGGLLSATIINVSGASDVINCAYVTYANEAKENLVSVSHETLETKGAVSKETAAEMCVGCAKAAKADMGLSTTGIAGPGGGTKEKPVGLVYLGCSLHEQVTVERHVFSGDREQVRKQAVDAALDLAIRCLDKE